VVRIHGPGAREAVLRLAGRLPGPGAPRLVRLSGAAGALDVALALDLGRAGFELHVHGSPHLVRALLSELGAAQPAAPRNAEGRALALLAGAASDRAARMLLDQAEGALRAELERLALAAPAVWRLGLLELAARARVAAALVRPPRVVLAGPPNAGKSTLFNALLGRARAVTSAEEGTTRDALREPALLGAYAVELVDTAGVRRAEGGDLEEVERAGQRLGQRLAGDADLVLWLQPPGGPAPPARWGGAARLAVLPARGDLPGAHAEALRPMEEPELARARVEALFHASLSLPGEPWTPGAAVPFEPALAAALAGLHGLVETAARARALARLLGERPLGPPVAGG
jgi:tRNA modification GTPase